MESTRFMDNLIIRCRKFLHVNFSSLEDTNEVFVTTKISQSTVSHGSDDIMSVPFVTPEISCFQVQHSDTIRTLSTALLQVFVTCTYIVHISNMLVDSVIVSKQFPKASFKGIEFKC